MESSTAAVEEDSIRVLLIDDHELLSNSLEFLLQAQPGLVCVGAAPSLGVGLQLAARRQPAVILLDQHLPDGDGSDNLGRFLEVSPGSRILLLTADATPHLLQKCLEAGGRGVISKERGPAELTRAIWDVHHGQIFRSLAAVVPGQRSAPVDLTPREQDVLALLATGLTNSAIASRLELNINTIRNHVQHISTKLGASSKLHALSIALRHGLVQPHQCLQDFSRTR